MYSLLPGENSDLGTQKILDFLKHMLIKMLIKYKHPYFHLGFTAIKHMEICPKPDKHYNCLLRKAFISLCFQTMPLAYL